MRAFLKLFVLTCMVACTLPAAAQRLVPTPPGAMWPGDACMNPAICHSYRGIRFFTSTTGYVFEPRQMFKTTDAGRTWTPILGPRAGHPIGIGDVQFLDVNTFFVVGSELLRTTDGGRTFTKLTREAPSIWVPGGEMHEVTKIFFFDADHGRAIGTGRWDEKPLMVTKDGGVTWSVWVRIPENFSPHQGLWMFDQERGLMVGDHGMLRTVDRGFSWDLVPGSPTADYTRCTRSGVCMAVTNGYKNPYISTDGGVTWKKTETGLDSDREIDFVNDFQIFGPDNAVIVGSHDDEPAFAIESSEGYDPRTPLPTIPPQAPSRGFILRWDGTTWRRTLYSEFRTIHAIDFVTRNEVWGSADFNGIIHSTDGGKTWQLVLDYERQRALTPVPSTPPQSAALTPTPAATP